MAKQVWLFDPRTAERKLMDLSMVAGITGRTVKSVRASIGRRIKCLNCYLLELDTPLSKFRELLAKEIIPDEVWRDIPNSLWQVSSYGRYRSYLRCQPNRFVYRLPYPGNKNTSTKLGIRVDGKVEMRGAQEWVYKLFIGEVLAEYSTLTQAAKVNYTNSKSIREAARKGKPSIGFRWKVSKEKSII